MDYVHWEKYSFMESFLLIYFHGVRVKYPSPYNVCTHTITVRYVPEWFPGAEFKRLGKKWNAAVQWIRNEPFEFTKAAIVRIGYHNCNTNLTPLFRSVEPLQNVPFRSCWKMRKNSLTKEW